MSLSNDSIRALKSAIKIAGSQSALANAIGSQQQNISYWLKKGRPPAEAVLAIEKSTGISRARLRPDLFGPTATKQPACKNKGQAKTRERVKGADSQGRWADDRPRCPLCLIVLKHDLPPSPCFRNECRHAKAASYNEQQSILQSSLNGSDYEVVQ